MLCLRYINRKRLKFSCQSFIGNYFLGLFMTKIVQGREITKFICFCVRSYYLCHYEYRKQIENAISVCLCTYLSLYL